MPPPDDRIEAILDQVSAVLKGKPSYTFELSSGPIRMTEHEIGHLRIRYTTWAEYQEQSRKALPVGPRSLLLTWSGCEVLKLDWSQGGRRHKVADQIGAWEDVLRREARKAERSKRQKPKLPPLAIL